MKINLSNSIINISKHATVICNFDCKVIEINDNGYCYSIYPSTIDKMKQDFNDIKNKLKQKG